MNQTTFQPAEIYDSNGNLIQQGAFGINTPFCTSTGDGVYDYIVNNLNALKDMIAAGYIAVATLPSSGQTNKYYVITEGMNAGKCYVWTGTAWQELTTQINGKSAYEIAVDHGFIGTEQQWLDSFTADAIAAADRAEAVQAQMEEKFSILDNVDARFGNIEDYAQMTDSNVEATKKRISNVEKLLQGNLYDYQTDETSAYTKTVPTGAMPYAGLEKIGGKTLVFNSLRGTSFRSGSINGVTFAYADGVESVSGTCNNATNYNISTLNNVPIGHKVYVNFQRNTTVALLAGTTFNIGSFISANNSGVFTTTASPQSCTVTLKLGEYNFSISPRFADLTLMFGSGNEPTAEEFEVMFPNFANATENAGTLLSAGVTEVVSHSNNLANPSIFMGAVSGASYTGGYWTCTTLNMKAAFNNDSTNSSPVFYGSKLTISFDIKYAPNSSDNRLDINIIDPTTNATIEGSSITFTNTWQHFSHTYTNGANGCKVFFSFGSGRIVNVKNFKIEETASETPYSPYGAIATYPVPAEVQALEGYGWSAGSVYNYVDFERKVFVKCVDRVDMGTLSWSVSGALSYAFLTGGIKPYLPPYTDNLVVLNAVSPVCPAAAWSGTNGRAENRMFRDTGGNIYVGVANAYNSDTTAFKSAMSGVYLYYELATPIEIDISEYLTDDNLIEVEAGGTLTFENQHGDDYRIPVPSEETYMINLQEAVSNG